MNRIPAGIRQGKGTKTGHASDATATPTAKLETEAKPWSVMVRKALFAASPPPIPNRAATVAEMPRRWRPAEWTALLRLLDLVKGVKDLLSLSPPVGGGAGRRCL